MTEQNLPTNQKKDQFKQAKNLPILAQKDGIIVFNKAAVVEEVKPHKLAIRKAAEDLKAFLDSSPDLSDKAVFNKLKGRLGNEAALQISLTAANKRRQGIKEIFLDAGNFIQQQFMTEIDDGYVIKKRAKALKKEFDDEQKRIAAEKAEAEQKRIRGLKILITSLECATVPCVHFPSSEILERMQQIENSEYDFQEMAEEGLKAKETALKELSDLHETVLARERAAKQAEEDRKALEAERKRIEAKEKELAVQQEANELISSVSNFANASCDELLYQIDRIAAKYSNSDQVLQNASEMFTSTLKVFLTIAEQREAAEELKAAEERKIAEEQAAADRKVDEEPELPTEEVEEDQDEEAILEDVSWNDDPVENDLTKKAIDKAVDDLVAALPMSDSLAQDIIQVIIDGKISGVFVHI